MVVYLLVRDTHRKRYFDFIRHSSAFIMDTIRDVIDKRVDNIILFDVIYLQIIGFQYVIWSSKPQSNIRFKANYRL